MNILVTGASGFTGRHMIHFLSGLDLPGKNVVGVFHSTKPPVLSETSFIHCDLRNREETRRVIADIHPDWVIHLAGVNRGFLEDLLLNNVVSTQNLLDSLVTINFKGRVLVIGSSAEYGYNNGMPVTENTPLNPVSDYGISKVASSLLALKYNRAGNLHVCVARPFNLTGPGQGDTLVCGRLLGQMVKINHGLLDEISLHSALDSRRDFIDVRDAVRAYWAIISHRKFGSECAGQVFNIGSGRDYPISEVYERFAKIFGRTFSLSPVKTAGVDPVPRQASDIRLITNTIGWHPEIDLATSLGDMVREAESEI